MNENSCCSIAKKTKPVAMNFPLNQPFPHYGSLIIIPGWNVTLLVIGSHRLSKCLPCWPVNHRNCRNNLFEQVLWLPMHVIALHFKNRRRSHFPTGSQLHIRRNHFQLAKFNTHSEWGGSSRLSNVAPPINSPRITAHRTEDGRAGLPWKAFKVHSSLD